MDVEHLRAARRAEPFRPFDVHMNDGRIVHVCERSAIAGGPNAKDFPVFDELGALPILELASMVRLEVYQPSHRTLGGGGAMRLEQLLEVVHATPFRPFNIHMADGRVLQVRHPDFISRSESGRTVIVNRADDGFDILDIMLMTGLEVLAPTPTDSGSSESQ